MSSFPKPKIYFYTFLLLIIYFAFDFHNAKKDFVQLNYNWKKEKVINKYLNTAIVDSINYNYLVLNMKTKKYLLVNNTYIFKQGDKKYYFRPTTITSKDDTHVFKHLIWLKNQAPKKGMKGELFEVDLPLVQKGNITVNTIGGTFLTYKWANYFRKDLSEITNLVFVGNYTDLFSYPHDATYQVNSSVFLSKISKIKSAEKYIIFIGDRDAILPRDLIRENLEKIISFLLTKDNVKEIIFISLPPSKTKKIDDFRREYNSLLLELSNNNNFILIDSYNLLDKNKHLDYTGSYPNKIGYKLIAQKIAKEIDE